MTVRGLNNIIYVEFKAVSTNIRQQMMDIARTKGLLSKKSPYQQDSLSNLLEPKAFEIESNNNSLLRIVMDCKAGYDKQLEILSKVVEVVSGSYIGILRSLYSDASLEIKSSSNKHNVTTTFSAFSYGKTGEKEKLFDLSYTRNTGMKSGTIYADISKTLASNPQIASGLFVSTWETAIIGLAEQDADSALSLYSGVMNTADIGGYEQVKEAVRKEVINPFIYQDRLESILERTQENPKISRQHAVLFYGPPGTGKTMMARALSSEAGVNFMYMKMSQVFSKFYSESPKILQENLDRAEKYAKVNGKTILFIDEIDYFGSRGKGSSADAEDSRVIDILLTKLDGLNSSNNSDLLVIGATNNYDLLDPAILSRFRSKVFFDKPTLDDRYSIFKKYAKNLPDEDLRELAAASEGLVGRDISSIAYNAASDFLSDLIGGKAKGELPDKSYYMRLIKTQRVPSSSVDKGLYS